MRSLPLHLLTLLLISFCTPGHAEIYKWVDENGNMHFSDSPHEEKEVETLNLEPAVTIGTVTPQSADHLFQKDFSKSQNKQRQRENKAEQRRNKKAALQKACSDAKQELIDAKVRRTSASSSTAKRYYNEKIELAKAREDEACKLSNFR